MNIFLGCTATKVDEDSIPAKDLYAASDLFRGRLAYANKLKKEQSKNTNIFILSAKYGLVRLNDDLSPYDVCLSDFSNSRKEKWIDKVLDQISKTNISKKDKTYFLCGKDYWDGLDEYFPNFTTESDLAKKKYGDSGMGYIKQFYHDTVEKDIEKIKDRIDSLYESLIMPNFNSLNEVFNYLNNLS